MSGSQNQSQYDAQGRLVVNPSARQNPADTTPGQPTNAAVTATGALAAADSGRSGAQALTEMMRTLGTLITDLVTPENADARSMEIAKCREQMAKI